jgi:hypothetical protein
MKRTTALSLRHGEAEERQGTTAQGDKVKCQILQVEEGVEEKKLHERCSDIEGRWGKDEDGILFRESSSVSCVEVR